MTPEQSRMARAALKWSLTELSDAAGVGRATVARFELGQPVSPATVTALRNAFEDKRIRFIEKGPFAGGVTLLSAG